MPIQPVFENISLNERATKVVDKKKVEVKTQIPTESISRIINVSAINSIVKAEVQAPKTIYGGRVLFYLTYEDENGEIKKSEFGTEYLETLANAELDGEYKVKASGEVLKVEADASGIFLNLSAQIETTLTYYTANTREMLCGGEQLVCDLKEKTLFKMWDEKASAFAIEEDLDIDFVVDEVLYYKIEPVITACQCGVESIICDGKASFSALLLQKGEKSDIIKKTKTFPFRAEIDCEGASVQMQAFASAELKSIKIDLEVDREQGVSVMRISAILTLKGEVQEEISCSLVEDAYSLEEEIKLEKADLEVCSLLSEIVCETSCSGECNIDGLPENATLKAVGGEKVMLVSAKKEQGAVEIVGVISATAYFMDENGKFITRKIETPFEKTTDCILEDFDDFTLKVKADGADAKIISNEKIELSATLIIGVCPIKKRKEKYVKSVCSIGEKKANDAGISVYIAREGETLWSLSKRLNTTPEKLQETNKDLSFPLPCDERIVIYRQKVK